ncbi:putative calcium-binding protein CML19 [Benincasa hispida]|uniref:putative calcium-binding protein CML19 n=1 Tax=Benincasa hispida TaxID=102211 RepID=UPI00190154B1|nr:putative calcium-binding protein CML19 [Benincasa hispida]
MEKLWCYKRVFEHFDSDGDGKISPSELRECIAVVSGEKLSMVEAEEAMAEFDSDGDGQLEEEDFVRFVDGGGEKEKVKELREAFKMYEMEGSGFITAESLRRMFKKLGETKISLGDCKAMIAKFDLDGDGVLSFDEFKVMMS